MNTYIMTKLQEMLQALRSPDRNRYIEQMGNELEMMRMEIEQHIEHMPSTAAYRALRTSAEDAVQKLTEAFALWEDACEADPSEQKDILNEMIALIESITY